MLALFIYFSPILVAFFATGLIIGAVMAQDAFYENMLYKIKEMFDT